jgi:hypothetical protein
VQRGIRPTKTESKNGWGEQELAAYVAERNRVAADRILHRTKPDLIVQNMRDFNPHHWQRGKTQ